MAENLGQHFLTNNEIVQDMLQAGEVGDEDIILEIGPGKGKLTEKLLEVANKVVAVEKDPELANHLKDKFSEAIARGSLKLIQKDIRDIQISTYINPKEKYKVIANIPYYLTSEILHTFLPLSSQPESIVLLVQKEVAERIVAKNGKQSRLSISVNVYGKPKLIKKVSRSNFDPPPEVDSAILAVTSISREFFENINEDKFFSLVKKGFRHKRKKLVNNLADNTTLKQKIRDVLTKCKINTQIRAEKVTLKQWECLLKNL